LKDAEQPGVTISEVCRRHGIAPSVFYRWRAVADNGSSSAFKHEGKRAPRKGGVEARHKAEIERLRAVVAEITAENLELKKRSEARRPHAGSGEDEDEDEDGSDADRAADEEALGVDGAPHTGRPGRAEQRVLRLEESGEPRGSLEQAMQSVRSAGNDIHRPGAGHFRVDHHPRQLPIADLWILQREPADRCPLFGQPAVAYRCDVRVDCGAVLLPTELYRRL
jgi:transposase-like protein